MNQGLINMQGHQILSTTGEQQEMEKNDSPKIAYKASHVLQQARIES